MLLILLTTLYFYIYIYNIFRELDYSSSNLIIKKSYAKKGIRYTLIELSLHHVQEEETIIVIVLFFIHKFIGVVPLIEVILWQVDVLISKDLR